MRLIAGAAAAVGAALSVSKMGVEKGGGRADRLTMLSWNVLARPYTGFNQRFHRAAGRLEEPSQTRERYTLAGEEIARRAPDIVFLQECEATFFSPHWNLAAARLAEGYEVFRCPPDGPGTAVLVRRGGAARVLDPRPACVGGSAETGGSCKVATIVRVEAGHRRFAAVSAHFAWDGDAPKRRRHAELLGEALGDESVVVAGDFNCKPGRRLAALESFSFLGRLRRLELPPGVATGLTGDFSEEVCIDHVYVSGDLGAASASAGARPASPWAGGEAGPARVVSASDHVPIGAVLDLEDQHDGRAAA